MIVNSRVITTWDGGGGGGGGGGVWGGHIPPCQGGLSMCAFYLHKCITPSFEPFFSPSPPSFPVPSLFPPPLPLSPFPPHSCENMVVRATATKDEAPQRGNGYSDSVRYVYVWCMRPHPFEFPPPSTPLPSSLSSFPLFLLPSPFPPLPHFPTSLPLPPPPSSPSLFQQL